MLILFVFRFYCIRNSISNPHNDCQFTLSDNFSLKRIGQFISPDCIRSFFSLRCWIYLEIPKTTSTEVTLAKKQWKGSGAAAVVCVIVKSGGSFKMPQNRVENLIIFAESSIYCKIKIGSELEGLVYTSSLVFGVVACRTIFLTSKLDVLTRFSLNVAWTRKSVWE